MSAVRMQHYDIFLQGFNFTIKYKKSDMNANADALSRLPILSSENLMLEESDVFEINQIDSLPITASQISQETEIDSELSPLLQALQKGISLPSTSRCGIHQNEFSIQRGCIMRGIRVVVPKSLQATVLNDLHSTHFGVTRMKELARSFCWWQGMDKHIEEKVKNCTNCAKFRKNPQKVETHH